MFGAVNYIICINHSSGCSLQVLVSPKARLWAFRCHLANPAHKQRPQPFADRIDPSIPSLHNCFKIYAVRHITNNFYLASAHSGIQFEPFFEFFFEKTLCIHIQLLTFAAPIGKLGPNYVSKNQNQITILRSQLGR
jgi:hypothetical protein